MYLNIYPVGTITTQRTILTAIKFNNVYLSNGICPKLKRELQKSSYIVYNDYVGGSVSVILRLYGIKIL